MTRGEVEYAEPMYQYYNGHSGPSKNEGGKNMKGTILFTALVILAGSMVQISAGPTQDPALTFSSYLGGQESDDVNDLKVLPDGSFLLVGRTGSPDFPTKNPIQPFGGESDGFVTKISSDGSTILFSTFLGGSGREFITSVEPTVKGTSTLPARPTRLIFRWSILRRQFSADAMRTRFHLANSSWLP